jgi:hypothetical protein
MNLVVSKTLHSNAVIEEYYINMSVLSVIIMCPCCGACCVGVVFSSFVKIVDNKRLQQRVNNNFVCESREQF